MKELYEHAPDIIKQAATSPLGILALMILVLGVLAYAFFVRQTTSEPARVVVFLAILAGAAAFGYAVVRAIPPTPEGHLYRLRVTVLGPSDMPVDDAHVWSSLGGEPKKVAGGWQFDIPAASVPTDGQATIYAAKESAFLSGQSTVRLAADKSPVATVKLDGHRSATVQGIVTDTAGRAVVDARVSVPGHGSETVATDASGSFTLSAHAADGQQVQLHAEKPGYKPVNQWHPAGREPVTIILEPE